MTFNLSPQDEIVNIASPTSQFETGESAYECVSFCAAALYYSGPPLGSPNGTPENIDQLSDLWYTREEGSSDASNTNGMDLPAMYDMLKGMRLSYKPLNITPSTDHDKDINTVRLMIVQGIPVIICGAEIGFHDVELGSVPYTWTPTGNHAIVVTGISPDGNFYVRDFASIHWDKFQPGTRRSYAVSEMDLISGTAIYPSWLQESFGIPLGWFDDGQTLLAPNGNQVRMGFRSYVLSHKWSSNNLPMASEEGANPVEIGWPVGPGTRQFFWYSELGWTPAKGVYEVSTGREAYLALHPSMGTTKP